MIFETKRLIIKKADTSQRVIDFYFKLWNNPIVMKYVGFPFGLKITKEKIKNQIQNHKSNEYDQTLIIEEKSSGNLVGECKLGYPDKDYKSITDLKLLPEYFGKGFGKEVKNGLCKYLFSNTNCQIIEASPHRKNIASQKMQEACGGIRIKDSKYHFPESMKDYTETVYNYIYHIYKENWKDIADDI